MTYDTKNVKVFYKGNVVWTGTRECLTGLWVLPLKQVGEITQQRTHSTDNHTANNSYQMTSKEELIRYLHQCLFCPPKSTLLKAIKNNQLATWPGFTAEAVKKYLPDS